MSALASIQARIDGALAAGESIEAIRLVREAQRLSPNSPTLGVQLLEGCMRSNNLLCAAHGARTVLRYGVEVDGEGEAEDDPSSSLCRYLGAAKAFGARVSRLRWCRTGEACGRVTNRTWLATAERSLVPAARAAASRDDGQLWSAEHLVSAIKLMLEDDDQWRDRAGDRAPTLNHATMQQVQGNKEIALGLYKRVLGLGGGMSSDEGAPSEQQQQPPPHGALAAVRAHAYTNLAVLETASSKMRARSSLEAALRLAPTADEAAERWLQLATVNWLHAQLPLSRHALRKALALRPHAPFAHALACELHSLRHEYAAAALAAARAEALQTTSSPQLPRCARWAALMPRLPVLWGEGEGEEAVAVRASTRGYKELLLGCGPSHAKLTGGGWHEAVRRVPVPVWPLADAEGSADEIHWCEDGSSGADEPSSTAWEELWRVLTPGGLLQLRADRVMDRAWMPQAMVTTASGAQVARFELLQLEIPEASGSAGYVALTRSR